MPHAADRIERLETRLLLAAAPLKDLDVRVAEQASSVIEAGDVGYFTIGYGEDRTLYRTDGTADGTRAVTGFPSGHVIDAARAAAVGETLFIAGTSADPRQSTLWAVRPKGKPHAVRRFSDRTITAVVEAGDRLFFQLDFSGSHVKLWTTDGTRAGTRKVLTPDGRPLVTDYGQERYAAEFRDRLVVIADDGSGDHGEAFWTTDGTRDGTRLLLDLHAGDHEPYAEEPTVADDKLFFVATNSRGTRKLFATDGSRRGTAAIMRSEAGNPEILPSTRGTFVIYGNLILTTDGTRDGTRRVTTVDAKWYSDFPRVVVGDELYYTNYSAERGYDLLATDGTKSGTRRILRDRYGNGPEMRELFSSAGRAFFPWFQADRGRELWTSGGAAGDASLVREIAPGTDSAFVAGLGSFRGAFLFLASAPDGTALWRTDGTESGTRRIGGLSVPTMPDKLAALAVVGDTLYFGAGRGVGGSLPDSLLYGAEELWTSDGTRAGTSIVRTVGLGISNILEAGDTTFIFSFPRGRRRTGPGELWATDGTYAGTRRLLDDIKPPGHALPTVFGERIYFADDGALWTSDGTRRGTHVVKEIDDNASLHSLTAFGGKLYFGVLSGQGLTLWSTDGTEAGTQPVKRLTPTPTNFIRDVVVVGDRMYFIAPDDENHDELWSTDGTAAGTRVLNDHPPDFVTGIGSTVAFEGSVYHTGFTRDAHALGLWRDGTEVVKDFSTIGTIVGGLTVAGDALYFAATDRDHGLELWTSDGTTEGTRMVADIRNGTGYSFPASLTAVGERLVFSANDGSGPQVWVTDGTAAGTRRLTNLVGTTPSAAPQQFTPFKDLLVFVAYDAEDGSELWRLPLSALQ